MQAATILEQAAFDHAPVGLVLTEYRIIGACNTTFADLVGIPKQSLIGQSFQILYSSKEEFNNIRDIGVASLLTHGTYTDERMLKRGTNSHIWCRFRAKTLTPADPLARIILSYAVISENWRGVSLTKREREVALHLAKGMTSKEIGRGLTLSPRTIDDVRARLLKKLDARNVADLLGKLKNIET